MHQSRFSRSDTGAACSVLDGESPKALGFSSKRARIRRGSRVADFLLEPGRSREAHTHELTILADEGESFAGLGGSRQ